MNKVPSVFRAKSSVKLHPRLADALVERYEGEEYVPPSPRDDPRLDRDATITARPVDLERPHSWAAVERRRKAF